MFDIDSNVPVPDDSGSGKGAPAKYPFKKMSVGDSFFVSRGGRTKKKLAASLGVGASKVFGAGGYIVRSVEEDGVLGARVWRLK